MKLPIVDFETAKELKKLGFNELHNNCYRFDSTEEIYVLVGENGVSYFNNQADKDGYVADITAPEQAFVVKWFRDVHDILVYADVFDKGFLEKNKFCYQWRIFPRTDDWFVSIEEYKTYEEAELEGIKEAINYLKNERNKNNL